MIAVVATTARRTMPMVFVNKRVKSDADEEDLKEIAEVTKKASPVYDSVSNPVKIKSSVSRM